MSADSKVCVPAHLVSSCFWTLLLSDFSIYLFNMQWFSKRPWHTIDSVDKLAMQVTRSSSHADWRKKDIVSDDCWISIGWLLLCCERAFIVQNAGEMQPSQRRSSSRKGKRIVASTNTNHAHKTRPHTGSLQQHTLGQNHTNVRSTNPGIVDRG